MKGRNIVLYRIKVNLFSFPFFHKNPLKKYLLKQATLPTNKLRQYAHFFLSKLFKVFMYLAGFPAHISLSGISQTTTEPAPTTAPLPT